MPTLPLTNTQRPPDRIMHTHIPATVHDSIEPAPSADGQGTLQVGRQPPCPNLRHRHECPATAPPQPALQFKSQMTAASAPAHRQSCTQSSAVNRAPPPFPQDKQECVPCLNAGYGRDQHPTSTTNTRRPIKTAHCHLTVDSSMYICKTGRDRVLHPLESTHGASFLSPADTRPWASNTTGVPHQGCFWTDST